MVEKINQQCGCGTDVQTGHQRTLRVQFLELDMTHQGAASCNTCMSVENQVRQVITDLQPVFDQVDTVIEMEKTLIKSLEQAEDFHFAASPTIRVGNREVVPFQGDLFGFGARQWEWQREVYEAPPIALIVDAILRAYASENEEIPESHSYQSPEALKNFFSNFSKDGSTGVCGCS